MPASSIGAGKCNYSQEVISDRRILNLRQAFIIAKGALFHCQDRRCSFKGIGSRDFLWMLKILIYRPCVPGIPLDNYFFQYFKFIVLSRLSFYCCTQQMLSVRPQIIFNPRQVQKSLQLFIRKSEASRSIPRLNCPPPQCVAASAQYIAWRSCPATGSEIIRNLRQVLYSSSVVVVPPPGSSQF